MAIRKSKDGSWVVDISNDFDPITLKQRWLSKKGYKTEKRSYRGRTLSTKCRAKKRFYGAKITVPMLYELLKEDDDINHREISYINTQENNDNKHIKDYFSIVQS